MSAHRRFGAIIAARTGSSRLPGKALLPLGGLPMIVFLIRRLHPSELVDQIVFATTTLMEDDCLADVVGNEGIPVFRGADTNVVKRFVDAAHEFAMQYVVRVTGDCPFVDAETLDYCLSQCLEFGEFDLASTKPAFPLGITYEIYNAALMSSLDASSDLSNDDREHLTKHLYDHAQDYNLRTIDPPYRWQWHGRSLTVDTLDDYLFAQQVVESFGTIHFNVESLVRWLKNAV